MAMKIVVNAKMRRTGICGAAETLLVDRAASARIWCRCSTRSTRPAAKSALRDEVLTVFPGETRDRSRLVDRISRRDHLGRNRGRHRRRHRPHREILLPPHRGIIAEDPAVVERFFTEIDSAILLHNASTQFADGGEFGMGAEIGIATGKMHARGPVGVEQLTSFKYRVRGTGQTRA